MPRKEIDPEPAVVAPEPLTEGPCAQSFDDAVVDETAADYTAEETA